MVLMDRSATLPALHQELKSFVRQQVSARIVQRRLKQHGLSARRHWLQLTLRCIADWSVFNGVIKEERGYTRMARRNFFQMKPYLVASW
ncbi:hypothetical protein TNCV_5053401 [Trichonephila clavipes]|nr:hypothetical protein TNCV_5053401 [Trichonephila clavipes]